MNEPINILKASKVKLSDVPTIYAQLSASLRYLQVQEFVNIIVL